MNQNSEELKFIQARNEAKEKVQNCQKKMEVDSCMKCKKMFECQIRQNYVKAVYESMSLGQSGGFEF